MLIHYINLLETMDLTIRFVKIVLEQDPSRHEALTHWWINAGPLSMTLAQH